jgi:hypothetical protein
MQIILAMDSDAAGIEAVKRVFEREIDNLETPEDADRSIQFAYRVYIKDLTFLELKGELLGLMLTEPDGEPSWKVDIALDEFDYRVKAGKYEDKTLIYKEALA